MKIIKGIFNIITSFMSLAWLIYIITTILAFNFIISSDGSFDDINNPRIIILTNYFINHPYWIIIIIINLWYTYTKGLEEAKIFLGLEKGHY